MRVDSWLWVARLVKSRSLGTDAAKGGRVKVGGQAVKPSREVRIGDLVEVTHAGGRRMEVEVRGFAERRGPASEAGLLYEETPASVAARERAAAERRLAPPPVPLPGARPTKRDRRRYDQARRGGR